MSTHKGDERMQRDAQRLAEQLYDNALVAANLMDDPRLMLRRLTDIITTQIELLSPREANSSFMQAYREKRAERAK